MHKNVADKDDVKMPVLNAYNRGETMNRLRWKSSWIDLCGDGRFKKERIKGKDKRFLRKWTLRKQWSILENDYLKNN